MTALTANLFFLIPWGGQLDSALLYLALPSKALHNLDKKSI